MFQLLYIFGRREAKVLISHRLKAIANQFENASRIGRFSLTTSCLIIQSSSRNGKAAALQIEPGGRFHAPGAPSLPHSRIRHAVEEPVVRLAVAVVVVQPL